MAFGVFDRDLNGDVSMEELEAFCDEVHREKKAIAASLKDLDSVIKKLDRVFWVIIVIIAAIVFVSIISGSAAAALTSAGTTILGLSWLLSATASEFLQSLIFVFVKHPFDVGDRVTVYGNTGTTGQGDDYYVTEISLLYTEFKKMEGHIVQAPNSLLNTLFILNHRRSGALADVFELKMRNGTPITVIEELKARMLEFVTNNRRDYGSKIIYEVRGVTESYIMTCNFICFHKSSFQNELLRLTRHNKLACELMTQMVALGIEQPRQQVQISGREFPVFQTNIQPPAYESTYPNLDPSKLVATRRRAQSQGQASLPGNESDPFQDVFESRRNNNVSYAHPRIPEEPSAEASGVNTLDKVPSHASSGRRHGLFKRSGTRRSNDTRKANDMV